MKLNFTDITIENFKTFGAPVTFTFGLPGFRFLTGDNRVDSSLGSNGAGKSTIEDAFSVVLFDKMVSGARSSIGEPWVGSKKTKITLNFKRDDEEHCLIRTRHPMQLTLDGKPITTDDVEKLIKHSHNTFMFTVIHGQKSRSFLDLKPAERLALFSDVQRLDEWTGYSDVAKRKAAVLSDEHDVTQRSVSQCEGVLETKESLSYDDDIKAWDTQLDADVSRIDQMLVIRENYVNEKKAELKDAEAELKELETSVLEETPKPETPQKLDKARERKREARNTLADAEATVRSIRTKIGRLERADGECSECGAELDISEEEAALKVAATDLHDATLLVDKAALKVYKRTDKLTSIVEEFDDLKDKWSDDNSDRRIQLAAIATARSSIATITNELRKARDTVTEAKEQIYALQCKISPFIARNIENKEAIEENKIKLVDLQKVATKLATERDQVAFWVKGFKEIRLYLIESGLKQFEVAANAELEKLGLTGWTIQFSVESETKSNTVTKGFDVWIKTPNSDKKVSYECWSGGEAQRLSLAATSGLSSLIETKLGVQHNVEFYDEPTEGLGEEGIVDLLTALSERASTEGKSIWIVDHNQLAWGKFDESRTIIKDPFSRIA